MGAMTIPPHDEARFHVAEMICRRFPPGPERQAWLDWLASCREGERPPPTPSEGDAESPGPTAGAKAA